MRPRRNAGAARLGGWAARARALAPVITLGIHAAAAQAPPVPDRSYLFFVASEGTDQVALVRFGPKGALVEHRTAFKLVPGDPASQPDVYVAGDGKTHLLSSAHGFADSDLATGPRNVAVSPRGHTYYVTTANGFAGGELLSVRIAADSSHRESQPPDTVQGREPLGAMPGAVSVSPDGGYAWVVAAAPSGEGAGQVTVVYLRSMVEVARIPTCGMPAGSRLTADGARHYSVCRRDDLLVEIDTHTMQVSRRLPLSGPGQPSCRPSGLALAADGSRIYVACEASGEVIEIDAAAWSIVRRFAVGGAPGAVALTADRRMLVVADRQRQAVALIDAGSGNERARLIIPMVGGAMAGVLALRGESWPLIGALAAWPASRVPVQVALSPDDRYAFVTVRRPGVIPGGVAIIDLAALRIVATVDVGSRASGVAFWKLQ